MTSYHYEVRGQRARIAQQEAGAFSLWEYYENDTLRSVQVLGLEYTSICGIVHTTLV